MGYCAEPVDAVEFLKSEQHQISLYFDAYFAATSESSRHIVMGELVNCVRIHLALEAEVFYPAFITTTEDTGTYFAAAEGCSSVQELLNEIQFSEPGDIGSVVRVRALNNAFREHLRKANVAFSVYNQAAKSLTNAFSVGSALRARKRALQDVDPRYINRLR